MNIPHANSTTHSEVVDSMSPPPSQIWASPLGCRRLSMKPTELLQLCDEIYRSYKPTIKTQDVHAVDFIAEKKVSRRLACYLISASRAAPRPKRAPGGPGGLLGTAGRERRAVLPRG